MGHKWRFVLSGLPLVYLAAGSPQGADHPSAARLVEKCPEAKSEILLGTGVLKRVSADDGIFQINAEVRLLVDPRRAVFARLSEIATELAAKEAAVDLLLQPVSEPPCRLNIFETSGGLHEAVGQQEKVLVIDIGQEASFEVRSEDTIFMLRPLIRRKADMRLIIRVHPTT